MLRAEVSGLKDLSEQQGRKLLRQQNQIDQQASMIAQLDSMVQRLLNNQRSQKASSEPSSLLNLAM